ncbi:MAG: phosphate ABC transporter permease PstA [Pseudomonadota bacterium]
MNSGTRPWQDLTRSRASVEASMRRRYARERRFRAAGFTCVMVGLLFLVIFFVSILRDGIGAFTHTQIDLPVNVYAEDVDPLGDGSRLSLQEGNYSRVIRDSLSALFPGNDTVAGRRALSALVSVEAAYQLRRHVVADPTLVGKRVLISVPASANVDLLLRDRIDRTAPEPQRVLSDQQIAWIDTLSSQGMTRTVFNQALFTNGDSREPELAGIRSAFMGSLYMLMVTFCLAFPVGVAAALYLEEFAPRNRWTDLIEININNLAAVPSIVYGLLGLAIFVNVASLPRSAPLVGGLVLALLTLPVIIISSRAAIRAVPPSIRDAALSVGASPVQTVFQHVLPLALPGVMTGSIIGMARALGESAPLLMIGMVAFVVDVPSGILEPATALPVQVYLWADSPERAFVERTSAAIIVLLGFLLAMNLLAVLLRRYFERQRRW